MGGDPVADMVSEGRKKGVGKFDKLDTSTFHCHLIVIIVFSCTICFSLFFSTKSGNTNFKKIKNTILKVAIKAQH